MSHQGIFPSCLGAMELEADPEVPVGVPGASKSN